MHAISISIFFLLFLFILFYIFWGWVQLSPAGPTQSLAIHACSQQLQGNYIPFAQ
jgi:hypothetical protein